MNFWVSLFLGYVNFQRSSRLDLYSEKQDTIDFSVTSVLIHQSRARAQPESSAHVTRVYVSCDWHNDPFFEIWKSNVLRPTRPSKTFQSGKYRNPIQTSSKRTLKFPQHLDFKCPQKRQRWLPPAHLLLDRSLNIGPLISRWELDKFKNCWNKSFWTSKILTLLYQQFSNL